jgi:hypothetical protein
MPRLGLIFSAAMWFLALTASAQSPTPEVFTHDPTAPRCAPSDRACADWVTFRRSVTGPYQSVAVAVHGDQATVIFSEPSAPRDDALALVDAVFGPDLVRRAYYRWSTGLDGWLEDLVLDIRVQNGPATPVLSGHDLKPWNLRLPLTDRLLFISNALHGTRDGLWVDDVSRVSSQPVSTVPEPKFVPADLYAWLSDPTINWTAVSGAPAPVSVTGLLAAPQPSAFVRGDGTLVALVIPAKTTIERIAVPFRQFAVESDLLLGAYRAPNGATIMLGRPRQLPMTTLPPLRFETLSSLVRYRTNELAQSYERRRVFAGRVESGIHSGWDWAPILLSSQLDDSEFGTLLNQADQMLKSWSQAGAVRYFAFNVKNPSAFPFGDESASEYFYRRLGTTALVFNWNTEGFTTIFRIQKGELLLPDRYNALPVLYMPGAGMNALPRDDPKSTGLARSAADRARDYFAGLGNPTLVRVAQNVLLYHIAQAFLPQLAITATPASSRWDTVSNTLRDEAKKWLTAASGPGPQRDVEVARMVNESGLTVAQLAEALATPQATVARIAQSAARYENATNTLVTELVQGLDVNERYQKAFVDFCTIVAGRIEKTTTINPATKRPEAHRVCRYSQSLELAPKASEANLLVDTLGEQVNAIAERIATLERDQKESRGQAERAYSQFKQAEGLARRLASEAGESVALDRVLERVRAAVAAPTSSAIRTPSLVLSRNEEDEEAIGGHNVSFHPDRVFVPGIIRGPSVGIAAPDSRSVPRRFRPTLDASARDLKPVLQRGRSGTLLEEMRLSYAKTANRPGLADITSQASSCGCDILVVRTPAGDSFVVRTGPPASGQQVLGNTAIVDALAAPPPSRIVRFEGFADAPESVVNIVRSAQLVTDAATPASGRLRQLADAASQLFRRGEPAVDTGGATLLTFSRPGKPIELLHLVGDGAAGDALRTIVPGRTARVSPGLTTISAGGKAPAVTVVFPSSGKSQGMQVEIVMEASATPISAQRLTNAVTAAIARLPTRLEFGSWILEMRDALRKRLNAQELQFWFSHNAKRIRVTERSDFRQDVLAE